ncbi:hypothetical protein OG921_04625 [Aldersonia sp. NBC_00410]|uniref:hypothetical protein n=1 Tax=Aldersonia sp. NBC_00410 TaxID=2975954 RepID=UPI00225955FE|nr:hypothetical protein [Aldersonia sp. NBC_00410]MCX5042457.1 hypothetical protein [Aldersonia sp. NBC_00410]
MGERAPGAATPTTAGAVQTAEPNTSTPAPPPPVEQATDAAPPEATDSGPAAANPQAGDCDIGTDGVQAPYCAAAGEKVIEYCGDYGVQEKGTTFYTDGTTGWTQYCADVWMTGYDAAHSDVSESSPCPGLGYRPMTQAECDVVLDAESNAGVPTWDQDSDTWTDENGDGVMQGYERCGTACGDAPTSGEIQSRWACEQGTMDAATCRQLGY